MVNATANYAFDKKSARSFDADGRMRVRDCVISVSEVNPYWGREIPNWKALGLDPDKVYDLYRDPAELERAVPSFNGPLMIRHVAQTAHEPRKDYIGGTVYDVRWVNGQVRADLLVMDQQAIDYVQSGELADLSSSYRYTADMTPGEINGRKFDGRMTNIEGNHVALVEDGRATGAHVADSALSSQPGATTVSDTDTREDKVLHMLEAIDNRLTKLESGRANDEAAEAEKKRAEDEAAEKAKEDERKGEEDAEKRKKKDEEDERKGEERAMDAKSVQTAIESAVAAERARAQGVDEAKRACRGDLGDMIAMDSAGDIYRAALKERKVDSASMSDEVAKAAYQAIQSVAVRPAQHAMDSRAAPSSSIRELTARIRQR